uniref:Uncharacterized protein n=1 Tax=Aegilops tauschii subsp. strangulata TaxID=200361 RepID=A0A453LMY8_AEGTS
MYPPPIGPKNDQKPVLCWEDYKWSPGPEVRSAASKIVEEFWWRFKCDPLEQEKADGVLEENLTRKVKQMLHEEKAAAIKRLMKKGQLPAQLTEVDENVFHCSGARNAVATRQFLVLYLRQASFCLCLIGKFHLHWMMFHTLEMQTLKTGKDPGISGA